MPTSKEAKKVRKQTQEDSNAKENRKLSDFEEAYCHFGHIRINGHDNLKRSRPKKVCCRLILCGTIINLVVD